MFYVVNLTNLEINFGSKSNLVSKIYSQLQRKFVYLKIILLMLVRMETNQQLAFYLFIYSFSLSLKLKNLQNLHIQ